MTASEGNQLGDVEDWRAGRDTLQAGRMRSGSGY